jgi:NAD(P)-dependent dehydrogenase (short-subunit alcohol dehydrogenase family)
VVIADLRPPPADDSLEAKRLDFITTDVSSWDSQLNLFKETEKRHGRVDVVVVNAGIAEAEQALENKCDPTTGDPIQPQWTTLNVNLLGGLITTKLALHYLRKSKTGGAIVLTGSRASKQKAPSTFKHSTLTVTPFGRL